MRRWLRKYWLTILAALLALILSFFVAVAERSVWPDARRPAHTQRTFYAQTGGATWAI